MAPVRRRCTPPGINLNPLNSPTFTMKIIDPALTKAL